MFANYTTDILDTNFRWTDEAQELMKIGLVRLCGSYDL